MALSEKWAGFSWITVIPLEPAEEGTDRWAVENNLVSITPLRLDLTAHEELSARLATNERKGK